jgi:glucose/arabinose dehydrogenase
MRYMYLLSDRRRLLDQLNYDRFATANRLTLSNRILLLITTLTLIAAFGHRNFVLYATGPKLVAQRVSLAGDRSFELYLPDGFGISPAAQGLKRVRFMAKSPDGRIFVTDMYNLADNTKGVVYILDEFDLASRSFKKVTPYLKNLRNPNSIAFHKDERGIDWFYLALTDRLLRYRFVAGEIAPSSEPEVLATFPDYGLGYKYGGWHLTRTIAFDNRGKLYVSVGSSCNACEEKEDVRASVLVMDADGKNQKHFAKGLRNAVGLRWINNNLIATNMGSDHLGDHKPADTMYSLKEGTHYGWPFCYQSGAGRFPDPRFNPASRKMNCRNVPRAYAAFEAHSSPLGLEYFDAASDAELDQAMLVALHGSTKKQLRRGYRVVRLRGNSGAAQPEDFITGFLNGNKVNGRPVDILSFGSNAFLLTDDYAGVVYYVYKK